MSDEDKILEARKWVPQYQRQLTWSADKKVWMAKVKELPDCKAEGESASDASQKLDHVILLRLLDLESREWPKPNKFKPRAE